MAQQNVSIRSPVVAPLSWGHLLETKGDIEDQKPYNHVILFVSKANTFFFWQNVKSFAKKKILF